MSKEEKEDRSVKERLKAKLKERTGEASSTGNVVMLIIICTVKWSDYLYPKI